MNFSRLLEQGLYWYGEYHIRLVTWLRRCCVLTSVTVDKLDEGGLEEEAKVATLNGGCPPAVVVPDNT